MLCLHVCILRTQLGVNYSKQCVQDFYPNDDELYRLEAGRNFLLCKYLICPISSSIYVIEVPHITLL